MQLSTELLPCPLIPHDMFSNLKKNCGTKATIEAIGKPAASKIVQELRNGQSQIAENISLFRKRLAEIESYVNFCSKQVNTGTLLVSPLNEISNNNTSTSPKSLFPASSVDTDRARKDSYTAESVSEESNGTDVVLQLPVGDLATDREREDLYTCRGLWSFLDANEFFTPITMPTVQGKLILDDERESRKCLLQVDNVENSDREAQFQDSPDIAFSESQVGFSTHSIFQRLLSAMNPSCNWSNASKTCAEVPICFEDCRAQSASCFSNSNVLSLEERLRWELRMVGLLDTKHESIDLMLVDRRDDCISVEIRRLYSSLLNQIRSNNRRKAFLRNVLMQRLEEELDGIKLREESKLLLRKYKKLSKKYNAVRKKRIKAGKDFGNAYPAPRKTI